MSAGRDLPVPAPGPPRRSRPAGGRAASAHSHIRPQLPAGRSVRPLRTPRPPPSRGHNPPGRPAPSRPKAEVCPTLSSGEDPSRSPELHSTHRALLRARRSGRRHRAGVGRGLGQQRPGPMAYFRLRVQANEERGAGLPPCRRAVVPAAAPGSGLGEDPQSWNRVRTSPAQTRPASLRVSCGQLPGKSPRGLGAAGRGGAPGLGRERTPSPDLELRGLGCSPPGWARRKIGFS